MRRRYAVTAGVVLVAAAAGAWAYHAGTAAGAGVRTVLVGMLPWSVAIDAGTGHAFVVNRATDSNGMPTGQGSVSMLDATGRAVLRTVPVGPDPRGVVVDSSPVGANRDGRIFVVTDDDGSLRVLDARTGAVLHTMPVGANPHAVAVDAQTNRAFVVNTGDGTVSVLDTRRWSAVRTVHVGADFVNSSVAADARSGRVFVAVGGVVTMLDAASGRILGTTEADAAINGLAIDPAPRRGAPDGAVFVAGDRGLLELDARTGRLVRTLTDTAAGAVAVDARRHRLVVAPVSAVILPRPAGAPDQTGSVDVLDERSGAVLRTVPVGVSPIAVAVDSRSGRTVVVNAGGTVAVPDPWQWVPGWLRARIPWIAPGPRTRTVPGSVSVFDDAAP